ncbi:formate dehydrogenase accessory protein FdhE [Thiolinea disciformis]|uniref:formate dehydrogenase accessory protein FdhE n=1 Tax=Thiolinea disciformis TaxID=125614 RepID=UPI0003806828|nr:formate dehydrogenase accessory protein FdhE [Thiolinea disciformis]
MSLVSSQTRLVDADNITQIGSNSVPHLLLPQAKSLFRQRARRLRYLAKGHALEAWLLFCAELCDTQEQLTATISVPHLDATKAKTSLQHGMPPISIADWQAGELSWSTWQSFLDQMPLEHAPNERKTLVQHLKTWDQTTWQHQAQALLLGHTERLTPEAVPFLGAVLQLKWTLQAEKLPTELAQLHQGETALCPVCGSHPMVSLVQIGDPTHGVRFLVCSLCQSQWHAPRAKCTNCDSPTPVQLLGETEKSPIQGECCDACNGYVKLLSLMREAQLEACADDLASLALDVSLHKEGYGRTARNLFLAGIH